MTTPWWRHAVIYQIYVRSFADSDGDGIGDLRGIIDRLGHVRELGADAVWLTPFYRSPQVDGGYDVANHRDVDPLFGSLEDVDALLAEAHRLGLRVIVDLVPNHTSDQHPWFREALRALPGSEPRARYVFRPGRGRAGALPPNDWKSVFGGPAWSPAPTPPCEGKAHWYLHLFAPQQPDLDWTNVEVREEFESILRFWFDRGVDGFRVDVAHGLVKDPAMPDIAGRFEHSGAARTGHPHWDRDEVHDVYRSWRAVADSYSRERTFVAEAWVAGPERLARYVRADELHTAFNFSFLRADWNEASLRAAIDSSVEALGAVGAPPTWVLSNHDVVRHVTRYGGGELGQRRARAAALLMFALPGGAYVYQGEELGLEEVTDLPDTALHDPTFAQSGGEQRGRDGCRVPLPWAGDAPPYAFGPGSSWLPQPAMWGELTVERQRADPTSMLSLYRTALAIRRAHPGLGDGLMTWIDAPPGVLAFARPGGFCCVVNLSSEDVDLDRLRGDSEVLLSSGPLGGERLPGDTAVWLSSG